MSAKTTKSEQAALSEDDGIHRPKDILAVTEELWRIAAPHMTDGELTWFSRDQELIETALFNMHQTLDRLGCNIRFDEKSGAFASNDSVSALLFFIAEHLRGIHALVYIQSWAEDELRHGERRATP